MNVVLPIFAYRPVYVNGGETQPLVPQSSSFVNQTLCNNTPLLDSV